MKKITLSLAAIVAMSACSTPNGVWLFTFGETEAGDQISTCEENLTAADCPEEGTTADPNGWTFAEEGERSREAAFGEVVDGPGSESYLVMNGEVYVGYREGGMYHFEWEHFDRTTETEAHESGYSFTEDTDTTVLTTMSVNRTGPQIEGWITTSWSSDDVWTETDAWSPSGEGVSYGQIGDKLWLEGDDTNYVSDMDCESQTCRVASQTTWTTTTPVWATLTDAGDDAYVGISGAGQAEGVPSF